MIPMTGESLSWLAIACNQMTWGRMHSEIVTDLRYIDYAYSIFHWHKHKFGDLRTASNINNRHRKHLHNAFTNALPPPPCNGNDTILRRKSRRETSYTVLAAVAQLLRLQTRRLSCAPPHKSREYTNCRKCLHSDAMRGSRTELVTTRARAQNPSTSVCVFVCI